MNITQNINIGGIPFTIDEEAYLKLKKYLNNISTSLNGSQKEVDEIMKEIEGRICEIFLENKTTKIINIQIIETVIKTIGSPEDFVEDSEKQENTYEEGQTTEKKMYRDSENSFIAGVASGIGHYFKVDTLWIRLSWIVLSFLSFGFSIFLYIILWILIPKAKTTAEKLRMKGQAVNISNIEKKIKEEFNHVNSKVKSAWKNSSSTRNEVKKKGLIFFKEVLQVFVKILAGILLLVSVLLLFVVSLLLLASFSIDYIHLFGIEQDFGLYNSFIYDSSIPFWLLSLLYFFVFIIPIIFFFVLSLRILTGSYSKAVRYLLTFFIVWSIAVSFFTLGWFLF